MAYHDLCICCGDFYHLPIIFAKGLDPDLDRQNVMPDLDPNYLTLWRFPWKIFSKKLILKKVSRRQKHIKNYPACTVLFLSRWKRKNDDPSEEIINGNFCCLAITFENSLYPDQDRHFVGPDLDPNYLTLLRFPWKNFSKKLILTKDSRRQKNTLKITQHALSCFFLGGRGRMTTHLRR